MPISLLFPSFLQAIASDSVFEKGSYLAKVGHKTHSLYFIKKGLVRYFYPMAEKEITTWFSIENEFVTTTSFFTQQPSVENIIALESTMVWEIKRKELYDLYEKQPEAERFGRLLAEEQICHIESLFLTFGEKSSEERYEIFCKEFPRLLQRVPLGYLASLLGMSQETLSRIRAKKN
jgi:CRP-like cAMP-binding protein